MHLSCIELLHHHKVTKIIVICYHIYESLAILKIVSSVFKIKNYSIQLFVMHVSSYFSFFELITIVYNEMSLISVTLLTKHIFNFVIWCIDLHAKICISIIVFQNESINKNCFQSFKNFSCFWHHCKEWIHCFLLCTLD